MQQGRFTAWVIIFSLALPFPIWGEGHHPGDGHNHSEAEFQKMLAEARAQGYAPGAKSGNRRESPNLSQRAGGILKKQLERRKSAIRYEGGLPDSPLYLIQGTFLPILIPPPLNKPADPKIVNKGLQDKLKEEEKKNGGGGAAGGGAAGGGSDRKEGKIDENAKAQKANPTPDENKNKNYIGGEGGGAGDVLVYDNYWPICAFVDSDASQDEGNSAIKGVVEMGAACGVNIEIFSVTIKSGMAGNYQDSPDQINAASTAKCNLDSLGYPRGSTTTLVPFPLTAAKMCGAKKVINNVEQWDPGVAGCAQLAGNSKYNTKEFRDKHPDAFQGEGGGGAASGGVAPSIEVPSGWTAGTLAHETVGHSQMGVPNGKSHGNGIGLPGLGGGGSAWTAMGCADMVANALPNIHQVGFDPKQEIYYAKEDDPQYQYSLLGDPPLFDGYNPPRDAVDPQMGKKPDGDSLGDGRVTQSDGNARGKGSSTPTGQGHPLLKALEGNTRVPEAIEKAEKPGKPVEEEGNVKGQATGDGDNLTGTVTVGNPVPPSSPTSRGGAGMMDDASFFSERAKGGDLGAPQSEGGRDSTEGGTPSENFSGENSSGAPVGSSSGSSTNVYRSIASDSATDSDFGNEKTKTATEAARKRGDSLRKQGADRLSNSEKDRTPARLDTKNQVNGGVSESGGDADDSGESD